MPTAKITVPQITAMKAKGEKIAMVTAYDYTFAKLFDSAGAEILLVGDSLGMVVQGRKNTLGVTMDHMIYHSHCVSKGAERAHVVCDLPFMSYQGSTADAIRVSGAALKKGRAEAVKMEGGEEIAETIRAVSNLGIPVMGHVGLMPQRVQQMGGYKVQGRGKDAAKKVLRDAKAVAQAGAYALVLEGIPLELAQDITAALKIPTIGIGSGPHCDGQVLVCYDLLGMFEEISPKFVKKYADLKSAIREAVSRYVAEVKAGTFPDKEHSFT
ncbi:MAG TPA: 3-methyl-2-oxobutanoate hydroxymethyltransferase [Deltaproteobacteria bacterium]|nr:3-methyl-2-oxobutanoate hydroxymethyltransferase [Deltaproteobacteria bacterium]